ncbi:Rho GTPase activating protein, partial [Reticulomyxa filosa]
NGIPSINASNNSSGKKTSAGRSVVFVDKEFAFAIVTAKRTFVLSAKDNFDLHSWQNAIENAAFGGRLHQGWLVKRGEMRKSWKKRWFVVFDTHEMRYYDNEQNMTPMGLIKLHEVLLMCPGDEDQYTLPYTVQLLTPDRNWVLAAKSQQQRDEWLLRLKEAIHGAKQLVTSHEGYLWKKSFKKGTVWRKRYFAMSKGWLFYFDTDFHCQKFKSIVFFSESFFQQAVQMYVKGNISLHETVIRKVKKIKIMWTRWHIRTHFPHPNKVPIILFPKIMSFKSLPAIEDITLHVPMKKILTTGSRLFTKHIMKIGSDLEYKDNPDENFSNVEIRLKGEVSKEIALSGTLISEDEDFDDETHYDSERDPNADKQTDKKQQETPSNDNTTNSHKFLEPEASRIPNELRKDLCSICSIPMELESGEMSKIPYLSKFSPV